ncbi:DNA recombination protein RmuC [Candidatus Erwinia haradaeae]|uniref:DNA recombination protein RmuC n=1 Tax=Candidatus Erwinia haradaeae TaxID=1922217 RepID=A0A451DLG4_9GAMM|nr:DNA recombination protein RmuC [Candidatus Erwinia haradaeae]VFP87568.1 DNA recombination protein RmuC [Candidatus Erwinia haradaeae]
MNNAIVYSAVFFVLFSVLAVFFVALFYYHNKTTRNKSKTQIIMQAEQLAQHDIQNLQKQLEILHAMNQEHKQTNQKLSAAIQVAEKQLQDKDSWRSKTEQLICENQIQIKINNAQKTELREMAIRLEETRMAATKQQQLVMNNEEYLNTKFENLANRIFENSGRRLDERNRESLKNLTSPLREQLEGFRHQVQESLGKEARERYTLSHEIRNLQQLNEKMAQETCNLTQALKGNNKTQGNWGEIVLHRILETAGMREGHEYQTQTHIPLENNGYMQPDVIIRLPQGKDVVIDSKMTLVAYHRYFNAANDIQRQASLKEHIIAIRAHLRELHKKDYQKLPSLRSLDYVLMFIPVESAFLLALDKHPELINEAFNKNIMLVSPTTLLVALRTINNLWHFNNQTRYAQKIAYRANQLYDKMRLFVDDMSHIGLSLNKAEASYQLAMKKLSEGRGNLIAQTESFRKMGIQITRPINPELVAKAIPENSPTQEISEDSLE